MESESCWASEVMEALALWRVRRWGLRKASELGRQYIYTRTRPTNLLLKSLSTQKRLCVYCAGAEHRRYTIIKWAGQWCKQKHRAASMMRYKHTHDRRHIWHMTCDDDINDDVNWRFFGVLKCVLSNLSAIGIWTEFRNQEFPMDLLVNYQTDHMWCFIHSVYTR